MRSLSELRDLATQHGVDGETRAEIMDALRTKFGTFDPALQIDPAKATDLNGSIDWTASDPFTSIRQYFSDGWAMEPKLDGARLRVFLGAESNSMNSGRRSDVTYAYLERADNFPHLRDATVPEFAGTILDGELMPPCQSLTTASGVTTKGSLNSAVALLLAEPPKAVATQAKYGNAIFMAFDVLAFQGESVMHLPYEERREILNKIIGVLGDREPGFQMVTSLASTKANLNLCLENGFEGVVLKRLGSRYSAGKRAKDWLKVKRMATGDFYIIGSVDGKNSNAGKVGSMKVAYRGPDGQDVYVADVAGITDAFRNEITGPDGQIAPEWQGRVIEVIAQCRTKNNRLRHPRFVRVRPDKSAADCTEEQFLLFPEAG